MNADPRRAKTLQEAAQSPNGSYSGSRVMAWITEQFYPGHGMPETVARAWFEEECVVRTKAVTPR